MRSATLLFCAAGLATAADLDVPRTPEVRPYTGQGTFSRFVKRYLPESAAPVSPGNSNRMDALMRAGNIYLSLDDAIALALENSLDIEYHRYSDRRQAETDLMRAQAGQLLRFNPSGVLAGFSSASSGVLAAASSVGNSLSSSSGGGGGHSALLSGFTIQSAGSSVPNLDPTFYISGQAAHQTSVLTSSFTTGTNSLISSGKALGWGIQKGFLTGTEVSFSTGFQSIYQNSPIAEINPSIAGNASLSITQPLLQGFGWATNSRYIRIAKNNLELSDLTFKAQVIATVKNTIDLYWDLVTLDNDLRVKQQALELSQRLYQDNKKRVEHGAIAPIDIVQAEAQVETAKLDYATVQSQVLQQEMILKAALTRSGVDSMSLVEAHVVPTDVIRVPEKEQVEPLQDMVAEAMAHRPELKETLIGLENARLTMLGVKNSMLPALNAYVGLTNHALAGQPNLVVAHDPSSGQTYLPTHNVSSFLTGGYGTFFSQIVGRNFPDYSIGFNLNVPLRNSGTRADMAKAQLDLRQAQIQQKQQENAIKLGVVNARIALEQARTAYDTAVKARKLQEQTFAGTRRKYELGTSSFLDVVLVQRDVTTAQSAEVGALRNYVAARTNLELVLGRTLEVNRVDIQEAVTGKVRRPPAALPAGSGSGR
jgi:outer membrane protein TolC